MSDNQTWPKLFKGQGGCNPTVTWYDVIDDVIKTRKNHISRREQCQTTKLGQSCLRGQGGCNPTVTWYDVIDDVIKTRKNHISRREQCQTTKLGQSCLRGKGGATPRSRGMTSSMTSSKLEKIISQEGNSVRQPNLAKVV